MVDEVISSQHVDPVAVAGEMSGRDGDRLSISARRSQPGGTAQQLRWLLREEGSRDENRRLVPLAELVDEQGDRRGIGDGQSVEDVLGVGGHRSSVNWGADTALTRRTGRTLR